MTIIQCAKYPQSSGFFLNKRCEKKGEIYQEIVHWSQNGHCLRNFPSHSDLRRSPLPQKRLVYRFNKARKVAGNWRWVCKIVGKYSRQEHPKEAEGMNPVSSFVMTCINMVCGLYKKKRYVKQYQ